VVVLTPLDVLLIDPCVKQVQRFAELVRVDGSLYRNGIIVQPFLFTDRILMEVALCSECFGVLLGLSIQRLARKFYVESVVFLSVSSLPHRGDQTCHANHSL
jgi:hypothetical protein